MSTLFGNPLPQSTPDRPDMFRILVLADLGAAEPWQRPVTIDRDNLDEVMQRCGIRLDLSDAQSGLSVPLGDTDDTHPDRLFAELEVFAALRQRRRRLQNDDTFAAEARTILDSSQPEPVPESSQEPADPAPATDIDPADLLSQTLDHTEAAQRPLAEQVASGELNIDALVARLIEPHVLQKADPRKPEFIAAVDAAVAETMRQILHSDRFQQIEAAWLGLKMLVRRLQTNRTLQIGVMHLPKQQLTDDLSADDDLTRSKLYEHVVANAEQDTPWSLVVGDYSFSTDTADADLLGRLSRLHHAAGAVFVAGAAGTPEGWTEDSSDAWQQLRGLPSAASLALAMPRVLARRPYGRKSDPIDSFEFEEIPDGNAQAGYLWMNAAYSVATLLGQSFSRGDWSMVSTWDPEMTKLALYVYQADGESAVKPCAEREVSLSAGETLSEAGVTTVHSVRDSDSVRIPAVRSLSADGNLACFWA